MARFRAILRCAAVPVIFCAASAVASTRSSRELRSPRAAVSFHPGFGVVAGADQRTASGGRFAMVWQESGRDRGVVFAAATDGGTVVAPPQGCEIAPVLNPLGGPWALAGCDLRATQSGGLDAQSYELYNIAHRSWRTLRPNFAALEATVGGCGAMDLAACSVAPVAVGRHWMQFTVSWDPADRERRRVRSMLGPRGRSGDVPLSLPLPLEVEVLRRHRVAYAP